MDQAKLNEVRVKLIEACSKAEAAGCRIVDRMAGSVDMNCCCPMAAVQLDRTGGLNGLDVDAVAQDLGVTTRQLWSFVSGFDGYYPNMYGVDEQGEPSEEMFQLGSELRAKYIQL